MSCLYILEINSLSVVSFAIIFSHSEGYLFTLLIVSFSVQKLLSLIRFCLFIFAFISITLGGGSRGSRCDLCQRVCLCFPLGALQFLVLHSDLSSISSVFECVVRESSCFFLLQVVSPVSQHHLLKRFSFLLGIFLPPL